MPVIPQSSFLFIFFCFKRMNEKHCLSLGFSKSQPWDKDLSASSLLGRDPRKHVERVEKWHKEERRTNNTGLLQRANGAQSCCTLTEELTVWNTPQNRPLTELMFLPLGQPGECTWQISYSGNSLAEDAPLPGCCLQWPGMAGIFRQTISWEMWVSFVGKFSSRTSLLQPRRMP